MKIEFKDHNYVVKIKKTGDLQKKIEEAGNNKHKIATVIMNYFEGKAEDQETRRHYYFYAMSWGVLFLCSTAFGLLPRNDFIEAATPFVTGFTTLCGSAGIASHIAAKINAKKSRDMFDLIKKMSQEDEEENNKTK